MTLALKEISWGIWYRVRILVKKLCILKITYFLWEKFCRVTNIHKCGQWWKNFSQVALVAGEKITMSQRTTLWRFWECKMRLMKSASSEAERWRERRYLQGFSFLFVIIIDFILKIRHLWMEEFNQKLDMVRLTRIQFLILENWNNVRRSFATDVEVGRRGTRQLCASIWRMRKNLL